MIKSFLYILGLSLGFFIFLTHICTMKNYEKFANKNRRPPKKMIVKKPKENEKTVELFENAPIIIDNQSILKNKNLIMLISVYNNNVRDNEWTSEVKNDMKFRYDNKIVHQTFPLNPYVRGALINNISLKGPLSSSLTIDKDKKIANFSSLFMCKINKFKKKFNYLIEIKCKQSYEYNEKTDEKKYIENVIYISIKDNKYNSKKNKDCDENGLCNELQKKLDDNINIHNSYYFYDNSKMDVDNELFKKCKNDEECVKNIPNIKEKLYFFNQLQNKIYYNIEINIGTEIFTIYNIDSKLFETDITFIGITIKDKDITFYMNDTINTFKMNKKYDIVADYVPITINDNGNIDMILYSFAYFNEAIDITDINAFKMYNYYYLFGANKINEDKDLFISYNKDLKKKIENII